METQRYVIMATDLEKEWQRFVQEQNNFYDESMQSQLTLLDKYETKEKVMEKETIQQATECPKPSPLVISTKTKCLFLSVPIPIYDVFWGVPVLPYWKPEEGVIKKQTKIICSSSEEYEEYQNKLRALDPDTYEEKVIKFVDNAGYVPNEEEVEGLKPLSKTAANRRKIKYKNERKITIGMCKKDVLNVRRKEKQGAFYNCVALTLRIRYEEQYYEFHAKIFNTGKIEVPGRMNTDMMEMIKASILNILGMIIREPITFISCKRGVLINSGFKCGFLVDRDKVHHILKTKYNIETSYDSCSYQGVKCKYYFNHEIGFDKGVQTGRIMEGDVSKMKDMNLNKKYSEVAFMIFRTGSCIIVGNCSKRVLYFIYDFISRVLMDEFHHISVGMEEPVQPKKRKDRKVNILCSEKYMDMIKAS
jgi:hypothetical protein